MDLTKVGKSTMDPTKVGKSTMEANPNEQKQQQQKRSNGYPLMASDYSVVNEIGHGVSATVYEAWCIPMEETVAIKSIDLERLNANLDDIRREVQIMSLIDHPNVLKAHCSFIVEHHLWVVMPFMAAGSCQSIMKTSSPTGFEEPIIGFILKETLKALEYLHKQGHIHRDVKAGNILIGAKGAIKVADFGVSACVFESGDRHRRNTFVGTPCWMAPEVIDYGNGNGYDHKADIWSFGITALELAHGHAPFSKFPPMKALLMQLRGAPPGLDYARDKKFSRAFREMVGLCLVKDPARRPSAEKLLKHSFFKHTKSSDYVVKHVVEKLPSLAERIRILRACEILKVNNDDEEDEEEENEDMPHLRRISGWNFNEENLKFEPVFPSGEEIQNLWNSDPNCPEKAGNGGEVCFNGGPDPISGDPVPNSLDPNHPKLSPNRGSDTEMNSSDSGSIVGEETKGLSDFSETANSEPQGIKEGIQGSQLQRFASSGIHLEEKISQLPVPELGSKTANGIEIKGHGMKPSIIQKKGRFSVTEEDVGSVSNKAVLHPLPPLRRMHSLSSQPCLSSAAASTGLQVNSPKVATNSPREVSSTSNTMPLSALLPQMQNILQSTLAQQDIIIHLLNNLGIGSDQMGLTTMNSIPSHGRQKSANERESELMHQVTHLQDKFSALQEEVHAIKTKNAQLEHLLNTIQNKEEKEKLKKEEASIQS